YCPRTHAAFGHPPHPFREFLSRGVRVCLGTDSLASNPDLDLLAEARFVYATYPDFPGEQLLRMVTLSGAEALGWADEPGRLAAGLEPARSGWKPDRLHATSQTQLKCGMGNSDSKQDPVLIPHSEFRIPHLKVPAAGVEPAPCRFQRHARPPELHREVST